MTMYLEIAKTLFTGKLNINQFYAAANHHFCQVNNLRLPQYNGIKEHFALNHEWWVKNMLMAGKESVPNARKKLFREFEAARKEFFDWAKTIIKSQRQKGALTINSKRLYRYAIKQNEFISSIYIPVDDSIDFCVKEDGIYINDSRITKASLVLRQQIYSCFDGEAGGYCCLSLKEGYAGYDTFWSWRLK
jgi:hypothetical protein